ncbi:hypothetical protein [Nocardia rhizosphaerae]|uniref:Uncharacterized protein n=1 Tax=Nocardia rhizosphaerae TaxID=1691571 RepID=A0ABV8LA84_9NOCA
MSEEVDPRAKWRQLPPEPVAYVEATSVETRASEAGVPAVDVTEDFMRRLAG